MSTLNFTSKSRYSWWSHEIISKTRSVPRLFHKAAVDSSLAPGTNCIPEKWHQIPWYKFLLLLLSFMVCGSWSWLSKISQYYVACLPCNSFCSFAGRPEWLHFKLHLDLQHPSRAEPTSWVATAHEEPNLQGRDGPWEVQRQEWAAEEKHWRKEPMWVKVGL